MIHRLIAVLAALFLCAPAAAQTLFTDPVTIDLSSASRSAQDNTLLHAVGEDDTVPRIVLESYGLTDPIMTLQSGGGTAAEPEPPPVNHLLGTYQFRGWDGSTSGRQGYSFAAAQLRAWTTEAWGLNNHGTMVTLSTTPKAAGPTHGDMDMVRQTWRDDGVIQFNAYSPGNAVFATAGVIASSASARASSGGFLGLGPIADHTIASGAITVTGSRARVDTEGGAMLDDLATINAPTAQDGDLLVIQSVSETRPVTVKDQVGNIQLAGDFILSNPSFKLFLMFQASNSKWIEIARATNG